MTGTEWIEAALGRYEYPLLRYAVRITGDIETARDIVQDTFLKLCVADRTKVEGHLAAWLFTVCRNRALDLVRKEGRMGRLNDSQAVVDRSITGRPGEAAAQREVYELLLEAMASLPSQQQEVLRLKFQDDLSYREISQVMGKSLGTISKLLSTALCSVRDRLRTKVELVTED
jgi:RNA polymerase sigma-70 factor (ECF subfamily)